MLIDWFTTGAQAVNFLVLAWLLKRFLYKPILNAIDTREKRIARELSDAAARQAEAKTERDAFQQKNQEFDAQRTALASQAEAEVKAERERLLEAARADAAAMSLKREETLRDEALSLSQAISRRACQEVFAIARKALGDLATTSLEERLGEVFTRRLREMPGPAKAALAAALHSAPEPARVRSAFELPAGQRAAIQNALNETFSAEVRVQFDTAPDLIAGIELTASGQRIGWSIADYLASLERGAAEILDESRKEKAPAEPAPQNPKAAPASP